MSAMVMDVRPMSRGRETIGRFDAARGQSHPRGRGFEVLSRIARTRASEDEGYSPRHRLDTESDRRPVIG
jgi:hypothetical protein